MGEDVVQIEQVASWKCQVSARNFATLTSRVILFALSNAPMSIGRWKIDASGEGEADMMYGPVNTPRTTNSTQYNSSGGI